MKRLILACVAIALLLAPAAQAGFGVPWWQGKNLELLDVAGLESDYELRGLNRVGGVYYPGEQVTITIASAAKPDRAVAEGHIEVIGFHTGQFDPTETGFVHGKAPRLIELGAVERVRTPVAGLKMGPHGLTGTIKVPDAYGMYAIVLDRAGDDGARAGRADPSRTLIGGLARVMKPTPRKGEIPQVMAEYGLGGSQPWVTYYSHDTQCEALARVGIGLFRKEQAALQAVDQQKAMIEAAEKHGLRVVITLGVHTGAELPWNYPGRPISFILPPERDPELRQWYEDFARAHWSGGEAGLWAVEHWNEPWEPFGISGWGADSIRYRQLLEAIHDGVKAVDENIHVMAACSVMNTEDKLLTSESRKHINLVDIMTDHYVSLPSAYGARVAEKYGKITGETETWGVHSQVLAAQFMTQFLSGGQRFINPCQADMLWTTIGQDKIHGLDDRSGVATPMPATVTLAAWNAFIQDRVFERIVFTDHLPYLYQFGPDDDARLVMAGRLTTTGSGRLRDYPWHQVLEGPTGTITIDDADNALEIRDLSGNVIEPAAGGRYQLRMDTRAYFITPRQDLASAIQTIRDGTIEGLRQVHIAPGTLDALPDAQPVQLPIHLDNVYNRTIEGRLSVVSLARAAELNFQTDLRIEAGAVAEVNVPISKAPAGGLPLKVTFTPDDGPATEIVEVIHVTGVEKKTMPVRAGGDAWDEVRPVSVFRSEGETDVDAIDRIWLPFIRHDEKPTEAKHADVRMTWDQEHLYIIATVDDEKLSPKKRLAEWDEDQYFWGKHVEQMLEPLEPWAKFLELPNNKRNKTEARNDPDWPKFQAFLEANPELKKLANNRAVRGYFYNKAKRPNASLEELSFHYCQIAPNFQNDLPFRGDSFQFAFDFDAPEARMTATHDLDYPAKKLPRNWVSVPDTDYEYSLYQCEDGKPELWRLLAPGVPRGHHYPHQERSDNPQRAIEADYSVQNADGRTTYRVAIPWSELGIEQPQAGMDFGFTFRFNADAGGVVEFGHGTGATKMNGLTLHPYWQPSPSNTIRWRLR